MQITAGHMKGMQVVSCASWKSSGDTPPPTKLRLPPRPRALPAIARLVFSLVLQPLAVFLQLRLTEVCRYSGSLLRPLNFPSQLSAGRVTEGRKLLRDGWDGTGVVGGTVREGWGGEGVGRGG